MRLANLAVLAAVLSIAVPSAAAAQEAPPAPLPSVTLPPELDRVLRDYERAWAAGDESSVAALFTEDGFALQNGQLPVRGREAIRQAYEPSGELRLRAIGYGVSGAVGYIVGVYGYGSGGTNEVGKFVLALRRVGNRWMIAADIDNTNRRQRPPQPPAPPTAPPKPR